MDIGKIYSRHSLFLHTAPEMVELLVQVTFKMAGFQPF